LTQRHHAHASYQIIRRGTLHRNAGKVPVSAMVPMVVRSTFAATAQDKLDVIARDADVVQFAIGKLCQFTALPGSLGPGQAVTGAPLRRPCGQMDEGPPNQRQNKFEQLRNGLHGNRRAQRAG
jgi:hypothetical protein